MLEWAIALDLRNDNPCDRVMPVLGPENDIVTHRLALPHKEVASAIEAVRKSGSAQPAVKLAFEFLVLTETRSGEVRLTTWDMGQDRHGRRGVDGLGRTDEGEAGAPRVAVRVGVGDPHVARMLDEGNRLVFPMRSGKAISMSTLLKMLQHHRIAGAVRVSFDRVPRRADCDVDLS